MIVDMVWLEAAQKNVYICKGSEKRGWGGGEEGAEAETLPDASSFIAFFCVLELTTPRLRSLHNTVARKAEVW